MTTFSFGFIFAYRELFKFQYFFLNLKSWFRVKKLKLILLELWPLNQDYQKLYLPILQTTPRGILFVQANEII